MQVKAIKNSVNRIQNVDLYLERDNGEEIYFEIKGAEAK